LHTENNYKICMHKSICIHTTYVALPDLKCTELIDCRWKKKVKTRFKSNGQFMGGRAQKPLSSPPVARISRACARGRRKDLIQRRAISVFLQGWSNRFFPTGGSTVMNFHFTRHTNSKLREKPILLKHFSKNSILLQGVETWFHNSILFQYRAGPLKH